MQWYQEEIRQLEAKPVVQSGLQKVIFYGSSTFTRWPNLEQCFPQVQALNLGFGGSTLAACAWFFKRVVPQHQPNMVMVYAGDNDLGDGRTPEEVVLFYEHLLASIRAMLGNIPVCFVSIKLSFARLHLRGSIEYANSCVSRLVSLQGPPLYYLDLYYPMFDERGNLHPAFFEPDGLHLSPAGYTLWQQKISAQLDHMLQHQQPLS
ncbi:GDSL-type esterase/lipase family protein [Hymenobacter tibetensis]|uniref:GDSL-type esterase/lipase family protein n=1 Tax=Hymenobacter tibetensis TaxID=497967 RepID=A0ABY4CZ87_9BACT|nr:GDSL-type esterase/lipase family protein [Hymenobacter tibetensis]UOG74366.1 GDSL-type esterase/lipase family protein [Hymenobacter tibetensis]